MQGQDRSTYRYPELFSLEIRNLDEKTLPKINNVRMCLLDIADAIVRNFPDCLLSDYYIHDNLSSQQKTQQNSNEQVLPMQSVHCRLCH